MTAQIEAVKKEKPSLIGSIISPTVQFEKMRESNKIWGAFFLLIILGGIIGALASYVSVNSSQMLKMLATPPTTQDKNIAVGTGLLLGVLGTTLTLLITALFYRVIMMFMSNDTPYKKILSIIVYASLIKYIGSIINIVLAFILDGKGTEKYTSLGPLFETGTVASGIGNTFEIFSIWGLILTGIGLHITAGISKKQATILIIILFIISLGFNSLTGLVPKM
ncbi:Yip1 family protein [Bacillus cereus]|uniref:Yip1 family protein n=1 Tax=Bacillus cereus TaxID=1396 RepID=UPI001121CFFC|nr:Yip1 family protein [Bacillus cereus]QDD87388.1 hypothetical protein FORC087_605 [Bacillus cereus]